MYASIVLFGPHLLYDCNTRYEWAVTPLLGADLHRARSANFSLAHRIYGQALSLVKRGYAFLTVHEKTALAFLAPRRLPAKPGSDLHFQFSS